MDDLEAAATLQRILGAGWKVETIGQVQPYAEELTPIGPQLVLTGFERRQKPTQAQLALWD